MKKILPRVLNTNAIVYFGMLAVEPVEDGLFSFTFRPFCTEDKYRPVNNLGT
jgi:hypothetical protein